MNRPDYDPDLFFYWHEVETRFRDLDPLNHVNNAVFNTYFEEARINFVNTLPELAYSFETGKTFVLVKCTIEYLKPVTYPCTLLIGTSCLEVGNTSVKAFQAMYHKETKKLHSIATTRGVWFDVKTNRPARVPEIKNLNDIMITLED